MGESASVLLVDDRTENLVALEAVLEPIGVECVRASSGYEALSLLPRRDFAVILLDVHMRDMDGFEAAALIRRRERSRDVPIIFITATDSEPTTARRAYELGAVDLVTKPYDPAMLRSKVGALVELHRKDAALRESEARFRAAFDHAPIGVALVELDGSWIAANEALAEIARRPADELVAEPLFNVRMVAGDELEELLAGWTKSFSVDRRFVAGDGDTVWASIGVSLVRDRHGDPAHLVCQVQDITERKRAQDAMTRVIEQFERALDAARDAVFILDGRTLRLTYANEGAVRQTGFEAHQLLKMHAPDLSLDFDESAYRDLVEPLARGEFESGSFVTHHRRHDGTAVPVEVTLQAITSPGAARRIVAIARDISERREAEERIAYLAFHDDLTGLPNRAMFREHLELALARADRRETALAVLYLDLNRFKLVNDSLGHAAGDELLRQAATRMRAAVRASDLLARVGGDEFLVLLSDLEADRAPEVAETVASAIHDTLAAPFEISGSEFYIGTSVGIAMYPRLGADPLPAAELTDRLLDEADAAMYQAKNTRTPTGVYTPPASAPRARLELITRLRKAVEGAGLLLHWMPIIDMDEERVCGAEALLRWHDPEHGWILPAEFLALAEESGVIDEVGIWSVSEAARQQAQWSAEGLDLEVAVNMSSRQLWRPEAGEQVLQAIRAAGADPARITVEVSEAAASTRPEQARAVLAQLRAAGVQVAIDDFAHSSLVTLGEMELDWLKIDGSLVREGGHQEGETMLRAIIQLARNLGLRPLAEGVETRDQFDLLCRLGCKFGQGHFFGRPLPAGDVDHFVAQFSLPHSFDPWVAWEAARVADQVQA